MQKERDMKALVNIKIVLFAILAGLSGCTGMQNTSGIENDGMYFSSIDKLREKEAALEQQKLDMENKAKASEAGNYIYNSNSTDSEITGGGNTYINNYYDADYFPSRYSAWSRPGLSISMGYGMGFGCSSFMNPYGMSSYGFGNYYDPFWTYSPYYYNPYAYNPYYDPYSYGYYNGYNSGFYNGYYNNNGFTSVSAPKNFGPRQNRSTIINSNNANSNGPDPSNLKTNQNTNNGNNNYYYNSNSNTGNGNAGIRMNNGNNPAGNNPATPKTNTNTTTTTTTTTIPKPNTNSNTNTRIYNSPGNSGNNTYQPSNNNSNNRSSTPPPSNNNMGRKKF
jgi:hypothetical protein